MQRKIAEAVDAALEISDAYRSFGAPLRAYFCTLFVSSSKVKQLNAKKLIKQALIIKDFIEIAGAISRIFRQRVEKILFAERITNRLFDFALNKLKFLLEKKLVSCAQKALQMGNWIDFQQTSLIAEGLEIDISTVSRGIFYLPPKAIEGYRHLAYYIPQTMVFYDRCLREKKHLMTQLETQKEWKRHVKICKLLGINSSLWKIMSLSSSEKIKNKAKNVFGQCEYGYFKRVFDWKKFAKN
ncbi:MAG: hypothetical protein M3209_08275 [Acidobacteriota bacterium]|nr:hypothetical protein [Acidobacteriota bacterium]